MRFAPLALLACLALPGLARAAEPDTYIFDVLALQPYKGNLARLVKAKGTPDWVKAIVSQGEGTAIPMRSVDIGKTPYRLDHVCKVHDCASNTLDVLWAPRGAKVWAALVEDGKPAVMLGNPPAAQAKALADAVAAAAAPVPAIATPAAAPAAAAPTATPANPAPEPASPPAPALPAPAPAAATTPVDQTPPGPAPATTPSPAEPGSAAVPSPAEPAPLAPAAEPTPSEPPAAPAAPK